MRISNNMVMNNMIRYLGNNMARLDKQQQRMATGKKIQVPSDDPIVAARALKLRTNVSVTEQYKKNVNDALSFMEITETALANMGDIFNRTRELMVQTASGGTITPDDAEKAAMEIEQLRTQFVHIANTAYSGRYIFSGYQTDKKLMNEDGTFAIDVLNSENIKFEIAVADDINVNVLPGGLFNIPSGDVTAGTTSKILQDFNDLISNLNKTGYDSSAISSLIGDFDQDIDQLLKVRADLGARMNRLELTMDRLDNDNFNFTKLMSENEDADMAEVIMNLQNEENVYKASLSAGAKIIQPSLVDFLR